MASMIRTVRRAIARRHGIVLKGKTSRLSLQNASAERARQRRRAS